VTGQGAQIGPMASVLTRLEWVSPVGCRRWAASPRSSAARRLVLLAVSAWMRSWLAVAIRCRSYAVRCRSNATPAAARARMSSTDRTMRVLCGGGARSAVTFAVIVWASGARRTGTLRGRR
jgi:hypothetical protein